jgi:hypothetical protein
MMMLGLDNIESVEETLLKIIADPKSAKDWLDKLIAEKQACLDARTQAQQLFDAATKSKNEASAFSERAVQIAENGRKAAEASLSAASQETQKNSLAMADLKTKLDERSKSIDARDMDLKERALHLANAERAVAGRESAMRVRENTIQGDEDAAKKARTDAEALKATYDSKIALLDEVRAKLLK